MFRCALFLAAFAVLCAEPAGVSHIPLPADLTGSLGGAEYRIRVPAGWNGTLLVSVHGYTATALEVAPRVVEGELLSRGYALAGSFFRSSEKEAVQRTHELTAFFNGAVGRPKRTIIWGGSFGGMITLKLIETYPGIYDGAIAMAGVHGGNDKLVDAALRFSVAYAVAFGWPTELWGSIGDLRDDLEARVWTDVFPLMPSPNNAANYGRWEFIRLILRVPSEAWWTADPASVTPFFVYQMHYATAFRARLEQECGGPVAQNIGAVYTLTDAEKNYLAGFGVDANELLARMNTQGRIAARRSARNHLVHYGTPTGELRRPVITIHGTLDGNAWVSHESAYRATVEAAGRSDNLTQVYVSGHVHATFTAQQLLSCLAALEHWLDSGVRPDTAFFPENLGFDNSFVPPAWPY
jgi:pimeloyl-ACP methyl ester carboxylesterase